ncbi:F0F1 ATP synthase subunit B [Clostridium estertheticum]|uniref:ATP synthase subunit b n=1 Tax=Clostridium estertheticum subsp. estertheticum TaxID=1552 RepID=A0A1J0GCS1_9CLOT|nr:F0F1 ATP synthase subunit B [Clostridium estertheticum]APC38784.1 ATP synthase F0 subunit B [Clostridium estertheticum subsp. estertheticum]MBU3074604.1 F0F1 ATP synthase subunit B [Clostridium estertheticum]MBU3164684.1 F0F1 ATP synthase subunit B [Clostridium estertheticum]MBU3171405.1 F0F1 ATP synthase subunit B [Clostridium estertheticum]MBU3185606.1 F0F1 ATP synthase subunit B [Clostridium estertheticum]
MNLTIDLNRIIFTIINFIVLLFVLKHFFSKPVNKIMDDRKNGINTSIKNAKDNEQKAENSRIEKDKLLHDSKTKGREIVEEYKVKAQNISQEIIDDAKKESVTLMDRSRVEIEREKEKAASEIQKQVIDLSLILSERALEKHIDEKEHRKLIEDFIVKVGS